MRLPRRHGRNGDGGGAGFGSIAGGRAPLSQIVPARRHQRRKPAWSEQQEDDHRQPLLQLIRKSKPWVAGGVKHLAELADQAALLWAEALTGASMMKASTDPSPSSLFAVI